MVVVCQVEVEVHTNQCSCFVYIIYREKKESFNESFDVKLNLALYGVF